MQSRAREDSVKEGRPPTWRDHPVRNVTIASYKKNKDGAYHRHNRMDCTAAQRARRDCFHDASWAEYFTQPRIPDGAVHLIIGDSLIRVLTRVQSHWQVGVLSFSGAATRQMLAFLEMLDMVKMYTVTLMMGTNDVSRGESRKVMKLHEKMSCILQELRIWFDPAILTICTVPYNMMFDQHAMEMNEKMRNINGEIRQIQQRSVLPVRLLDVAELMEQSLPRDASSDGIHFDTPKVTEWLDGVFQRHVNQLESDLIEMAQFTLGPPPIPPFYVLSMSLEVQESVTSRFGPKTRVAFTTSPGYASMPPALQFVYAMLVLLTNGELTAFHRLIKYGEPLSMGKAHPSTETYSYKSTAGLKTLLVEYLLMQNRYLTGEEKNPREE